MRQILLALSLVLISSPVFAAETLNQSEKRLIEAFEFLTENYLYPIDSEEMVNRLITQMVSDLDGHTKFLKPKRAERYLNRFHGEDNMYVESQLVGKKNDILYSRIKLFGQNVSKQLTSDIFKFQLQLASKRDTINGFILDLRHNSGGWLTESVAIVNMFIGDGLILEKRGKHGEVLNRIFAESKIAISKRVPIIILIDNQTASAAELVASALKDHDRARLLGTTTLGKATVQSQRKFRNGSSLWVTVVKYYTKSGNEIHYRGVTPNIVFIDRDGVTIFGTNDSAVKKAIEVLMLDR